MSLYQNFCKEEFDGQGQLSRFTFDYPETYNFAYDVVDKAAEETPHKLALVWCNPRGEEKIFNFADIKKYSDQAASALRAQGIQKGDTVLVMLKRHFEYWFVAVALHKLGAILAPVTHMLTPEDIVYRVKAAGIRAAICTPEDDAPAHFAEARRSCHLPTVWTVRESYGDFRNLTEDMAAAEPFGPRVPTLARDPILTYFTSGTTGYPKGVTHNHGYSLAHIVTAKYWLRCYDGGLHFTVAETGWGKASWGKLYGQWLVGSAVMVFDFDNFDPRQLMNVINKYGVTGFCAPPTIYRYLIKTGLLPMPSLKSVSTAGEALNPEVFLRFREATGLTIAEGFGQTESTLLLACFSGQEARPGSMGKPSPIYRLDLRGANNEAVKTGEIGEIVVLAREDGSRPEGLFYGYIGNDALYQYVWRDGVYHTGDTAWRDEDGYFWFNGRIDDIIKTGGYRVGPYEIENVLMEHPAVLECSVVGIADPLRGQAIKAFVHLSPGVEGTAALQKELKQFCNTRVSAYKWIRHMDFVQELPKTISGKIKKRDLRSDNSGQLTIDN
jgi:acetyl-CoA synthetase